MSEWDLTTVHSLTLVATPWCGFSLAMDFNEKVALQMKLATPATSRERDHARHQTLND